MLNGLLLILICQAVGEVVQLETGLPIGGPILGMALLFAYLSWRGEIGDAVERASAPLLGNLGLLFIPAGVGAW